MGMGEPLDNFDNFVKAVGFFQNLMVLAISEEDKLFQLQELQVKLKN